ncbi:MAG: hypothetical protein NVSMB18_19480 [Acetobacteraceae bacterium]
MTTTPVRFRKPLARRPVRRRSVRVAVFGTAYPLNWTLATLRVELHREHGVAQCHGIGRRSRLLRDLTDGIPPSVH